MNRVCHYATLHVDPEHVPVHCTRTCMYAVLCSGQWNFLGFHGYLECCFTFLFSVSLLKLFGFSFLLILLRHHYIIQSVWYAYMLSVRILCVCVCLD